MEDDYAEPQGYGWVVFAAVLILLAATLNLIYGIAAIGNSQFYVSSTHFVISDLKTWGWVVLAFGVVQYCAALGILVQASWARWTGVAVAAINAVAQLVFLPAAPFLSLSVFALDLLVIYGLIAYGGRQTASA
ncbi:MAG TPA: hypothetical protein VK655_12340 [Solirubrobacteraceae bacterium]|jgi:hypothetical protein|nr:hypothetical protein [Solirubrobacteraceae bacterium]